AELQNVQDSSQNGVLSGSVHLDTLSPQIEPLGILKNGIQGSIFAHGQLVPISWSVTDPAGSTGYASGLDPDQGMRVGYTSNADCSNAVTWLTEWSAPQSQMQLPW